MFFLGWLEQWSGGIAKMLRLRGLARTLGSRFSSTTQEFSGFQVIIPGLIMIAILQWPYAVMYSLDCFFSETKAEGR